MFKSLLMKLFGKNNNNDIICNKNRTKKLYFTGHEELTISVSNDKIVEKISDTSYKILQKYKDKPQLILKFIESKGTKVVVLPALLPFLKFLNYEEGFIPKHSNTKAFILNLLISILQKEKFNFHAELPDLFIVCKKDISLYFLAYQFHHWLSYQNKLPGYDTETLNLFRNTFNNDRANMSLLSINQILSLKDAIDRDSQAIEFVRKFVREQVGAKEKLNFILNGKKINI